MRGPCSAGFVLTVGQGQKGQSIVPIGNEECPFFVFGVCLTIPPTTTISEFIGQLKGASAHEVNQKRGDGGNVLAWQSGYGVVSFGTRDLEWVKAYVSNQRERHALGKVEARLERIMALEDTAEAKPREAP